MVSSLTSPPTPAAPGNHTEYQQTTCTMQFSPCLFLHGSCPVFKHAERKQVQWVMLAKAFPRLVGRVKLVWTLCEFWWWKVQWEYGYVWMVSPFASPPAPPTPPRPAAPRNHTEYQQQLVQWFFPHVCSCMGSVLAYKHAERNRYGGLCWPRLSQGWLVR